MANHRAADPSQHSYDKDNDPHVYAVDRLVSELSLPAEEVNRTYREVLEELKKDVSVNVFFPVLVSRVVKHRLLQHQ